MPADYYRELIWFLRAARREAFSRDAWSVAGELDELIEEVEFLDACRQAEAPQ